MTARSSFISIFQGQLNANGALSSKSASELEEKAPHLETTEFVVVDQPGLGASKFQEESSDREGYFGSTEFVVVGQNELQTSKVKETHHDHSDHEEHFEHTDFIVVDQPKIDQGAVSGLANSAATEFNITLNYSGDPAYQAAFTQAVAFWENVITGDIADGFTNGGIAVDDLRIDASILAIDGAGGTLGRAGPTEIRNGSNLPILGIMEFDEADIAEMASNGTLLDVIIHEMGHVLGVGTLWETLGLTAATTGPGLYQYVGTNGLAQYQILTGRTETFVPIESDGGSGTARGHWDETIFDHELMTGFIEQAGTTMPISAMTIGSLQDMGYTVDYNQAQPYALPNGAPLDDFAQTTSTQGSVAINNSVTGNIEIAGDEDWIKVEFIAGRQYVINLEGSATSKGTLSDPYLDGIMGPNGVLIAGTVNDDASFDTRNSQVTFTATTTGTHYISASSFGGDRGTYTLTVTGDATPHVPDVDISVTGSPTVNAPNGYLPGSTIDVNFTVNNSGTDATVQTTAGVYLSLDTEFTTDDIFLGSVSLTALAAGASRNEAVSALIPADLVDFDQYYIGLILDPMGDLTDTDVSNNVVQLAGPVWVLPEETITVFDQAGNPRQTYTDPDGVGDTTWANQFLANLMDGDRVEIDQAAYDVRYPNGQGVLTATLTNDNLIFNMGENRGTVFDLFLGGGANNFTGGGGNRFIIDGNGNDNTIQTGAGQDTLRGQGGNDQLFDPIGDTEIDGGDGNDLGVALGGNNTFTDSGAPGPATREINDVFAGGAGDDVLQGGSGNDVLVGDIGSNYFFGADTIVGGADDDLLMGSEGADVFVFSANDGNDTIAEFDFNAVLAARALNPSDIDSIVLNGADFESGLDQIHLHGATFASINSAADALAAVSDVGGHAVFNADGTTITFHGLTTADLAVDDFILI